MDCTIDVVVCPYVMARLPRATFTLLLSLLPAMASLIGAVVLHQLPTVVEAGGIALVIGGVWLHRAV